MGIFICHNSYISNVIKRGYYFYISFNCIPWYDLYQNAIKPTYLGTFIARVIFVIKTIEKEAKHGHKDHNNHNEGWYWQGLSWLEGDQGQSHVEISKRECKASQGNWTATGPW